VKLGIHWGRRKVQIGIKGRTEGAQLGQLRRVQLGILGATEERVTRDAVDD